ncbi:MAG: hypothetical protein SVU32_05765 [Candidatus Nanohaloarchaea archaeon]|nr:hypothetical protein [Candidatus Nanohaloarchaea archaeon]
MALPASLELSALLGLNNIVLFIVLILLFVVGYKLMQAVIQTILVAVMSGLFLVALSVTNMGPPLTVSNVTLFMVLGVGLYILYSTLNTAKNIITFLWSLGSSIIDLVVPEGLLPSLPLLGGEEQSSSESKKGQESNDGEDDSNEKMVILKEVDDDE